VDSEPLRELLAGDLDLHTCILGPALDRGKMATVACGQMRRYWATAKGSACGAAQVPSPLVIVMSA
jgi:hypothetical protein